MKRLFQLLSLTQMLLVEVDGCLLTCDQTKINACKSISVRIETSPVLAKFLWSYEKDVLVPYSEPTPTWMLMDAGITMIDKGISVLKRSMLCEWG